jgi:nucleoside-diphosphate kinase
MKTQRLSDREAQAFYAVHKDEGFFSGLIGFMTACPAVVMALQSPHAIKEWRELIGAVNPEKAAYQVPFFLSTSELL